MNRIHLPDAAHRPALHRASLAAALALSLSACAHLPSPPDQAGSNGMLPVAPTQWTAAPATEGVAATALTQWWQRFNDPALGALVTQALQANSGVRSAQAALQQARAQRDVQQANNGPSLSASGSAQRSRSGTADASSRFDGSFSRQHHSPTIR